MLPPRMARQIERALNGLAYGSIQLVIHDSQLVRIERVERLRLTGSPEALPCAGGQPTEPSEVCQDE